MLSISNSPISGHLLQGIMTLMHMNNMGTLAKKKCMDMTISCQIFHPVTLKSNNVHTTWTNLKNGEVFQDFASDLSLPPKESWKMTPQHQN